MKTIKTSKLVGFILAVVMVFLLNTNANASNIQIPTEPRLASAGPGRMAVIFDLTWEFSWRSDQLRNWDGAWVFVKYRIGMDHWHHMYLDANHNPRSGVGGAGTGIIENGVTMTHEYGWTEGVATGATGVFLHRAGAGHGDIDWRNITLVWHFDHPDNAQIAGRQITADCEVIVRVFAMEMVFVPEGRFFLGDGSNRPGVFTRADQLNNIIIPFEVRGEGPISIGLRPATTDGLADVQGWLSAVGDSAVIFAPSITLGANAQSFTLGNAGSNAIPGAFPKGYRAFWIMKYEITQSAYMDFLNTLTTAQQQRRIRAGGDAGVNAHAMTPPDLTGVALTAFQTHRSGIRVRTPGVIEFGMNMTGGAATFDEENDGHGVALAMGPADVLAFLDWAGLRPMTELEFEKASRGPLQPIPGEFPWGATFQVGATAAAHIVNRGQPTEAVTQPAGVNHNNTVPGTANAVTAAQMEIQVQMVTRNGAFATPTSDRIKAGATFWGVMEMGSNLAEPVVNMSTEQGRMFTGRHGDGRLSYEGSANVQFWPYGDADDRGFEGIGHRGGNVGNGWVGGGLQTLSQRDATQNNWGHRYFTGGRGVRTAGIGPPAAAPPPPPPPPDPAPDPGP